MLKLRLTKKEYDLVKNSSDGIDFDSFKIDNPNDEEVMIKLKDDDDLVTSLIEKIEHILQTEGFDADYQPTKKGLLCESVIDKLSAL